LLRSIEWIVAGIAALMAVIVWGASGWLAGEWLRVEKLPTEVVAQAFAIMGLVTALRFIEGVYRSSLAGLQRQVLLNGLSALMATLRGLGAVGVLVWAAPTLEAFFLWQAGVSLFTIVSLAVATYGLMPRGNTRGRFRLEALLPIWRFAGGMLGITVLSLLLTQVDKVILSKLLTLTDYGYYTLAAAVAGSIFMFIGPIAQAWYPRFCALHAADQQAQLAASYHQATQLLTVIAGSVAVVVALFSRELLLLWTQNDELAARAAPIASLLILGNLLNGLMTLPYQMQLAHGWTSLTVKINLATVLVIVPLLVWVTPRWGALGAAGVWVGLNAFYVLVAVHFMYRRILAREKWRWYGQDLLIPLMPALAVAGMGKVWVLLPAGRIEQFLLLLMIGGVTLLASALISCETRTVLTGMFQRIVNKRFRIAPNQAGRKYRTG
jgi:O-antigen/teichoic acid export membrane protein